MISLSLDVEATACEVTEVQAQLRESSGSAAEAGVTSDTRPVAVIVFPAATAPFTSRTFTFGLPHGTSLSENTFVNT